MKSPGLILFVATSFWGLYWVPIRELEAAGLTSTWSVSFFNACPLIVLLPYVIWKRETQFRHLRTIAFIGVFTGLGLSLYASGLVFSSVIRVTLLFYLTPIWSTIIGVIWLSEKLTLGRATAIALGLGGLWLLLAANDGKTQPLNIGDAMALASGVFWGMGAAGVKKWPHAATAASVAAQLTVTFLSAGLLAFFAFGDDLPSSGALLAALPIGFSTSVFILLPSLLAIFWASRILFPGRAGILMMSEAVVAIISASLLLPDEVMTVWQWVGGATIIAACLVEVALSRTTAT